MIRGERRAHRRNVGRFVARRQHDRQIAAGRRHDCVLSKIDILMAAGR